ncbi:MAG: WYL domain-containing protein [Desulfobulbaceae bacterium]|nr:WYL domain-containing protein [Desulfobulbaceae bacterium]
MSILERIYFFHSRIMENRFPNSTDLVGEFEVSSATAHRDINYLRDRLLAPLAFNQRRNGYYYEKEGFRLPFEESPKIVLFLGVLNAMASEAGLADLPELQQLRQKLSSLVTHGRKRLEDLIHCEWVEMEPVDPKIFNRVIGALLTQVQIRINYARDVKNENSRNIDPLKLINYQGRWYLLGWCHLRKARRLFHLSRIKHVSPTQQKSHHALQPDDPYLTAVFGIFKGEAKFSATIEFTGRAAEIVRHQRWHDEQQIHETDHGLALTLPVADDRELVMKVLQFGSLARVVGPEELQQKVRQEIERMSALYGNRS